MTTVPAAAASAIQPIIANNNTKLRKRLNMYFTGLFLQFVWIHSMGR